MASSRSTRLGAARAGPFRHRAYYLAVAARRERGRVSAPRSELQLCFERAMEVTHDPVLREALREIVALPMNGRHGTPAPRSR